MPDYRLLRMNMVETQVRTSDVTDIRVHEALRSVPRERFVPTARRALAYADAAVEVIPGRFLLEARSLGKMLQAAEIGPDDSVLDIGCLTGYTTAVLARMAKHVVGLEQDAELMRIALDLLPTVGAANAEIVQGGLTEGHKPKAPYDVIIINGGVENVPEALFGQLAEGGRLVAILQTSPEQAVQGQVNVFLREQSRVGKRYMFDAAAPALAGFRRKVGFVF